MEAKLIELLKLCIEKKLNFDYSTTGVVTISLLDKTKEFFTVYYRKSMYPEDLDELIEKVKDYVTD